MKRKERVVVAMSGGVDSAVAAGLLVRARYEVIGITMRLWTVEDPDAPRAKKRSTAGAITSASVFPGSNASVIAQKPSAMMFMLSRTAASSSSLGSRLGRCGNTSKRSRADFTGFIGRSE